MELSESAHEFSKLILKHFDEKNRRKEETKSVQENEKKEEFPKSISEKYKLDYKKFEGLKDEENERAKEIFENNSYFTQMGCSHDRRKVQT